MEKTYYNKLVRDKIPNIIAEQGKPCGIRLMTDAEYLDALNAKLEEEVAEYQQSGSVEELADILEVVYAIALAKKCPSGTLDSIRQNKANERGRFIKQIMLEYVEDMKDG